MYFVKYLFNYWMITITVLHAQEVTRRRRKLDIFTLLFILFKDAENDAQQISNLEIMLNHLVKYFVEISFSFFHLYKVVETKCLHISSM